MLTLIRNHKLKIAIAITIVVRIVFLFALGRSVFFYEQTGLIHGSSAYDEYALNLLDTGVYGREAGLPDARIAPLYSYLVAGVYAILGRNGLAIGLVHIVLDCITVALVYDIARRLFKRSELFGQAIGEWVGFGAGILTACYPYLVFQNLTLIDTPLFMTLMYLFVWLMILLRDQETYSRRTLLIAILGGLVLGITTLVRALLPLFAILTGIWFLMRLRFVDSVLRLLPVAIVSLLVLLPWMWRGYQIYDGFVTVALNTGDNLWQGNNPMTVPIFEAGYDAQWSPPPETSTNEDNFYLKNQILTQEAINYLQANPDDVPNLLWTKFLVYWTVEITPRKNLQDGQSLMLDNQGELLVVEGDADVQDVETLSQYDSGLFDRVARPVHIAYFAPLLILALIGLALSASQWRDVSLIWFLQISMTVMYLIFHPSTRYRVPTDPLLFTFSAYAVIVFIQNWLAHRK
ncbi:MAG: glycosyltransferase family 39 protein [Chloroflexota bacterium]